MIIVEEHKCSICGEALKKETFNPYPIRTVGECCKECYDKVEAEKLSNNVMASLPVEVKL